MIEISTRGRVAVRIDEPVSEEEFVKLVDRELAYLTSDMKRDLLRQWRAKHA